MRNFRIGPFRARDYLLDYLSELKDYPLGSPSPGQVCGGQRRKGFQKFSQSRLTGDPALSRRSESMVLLTIFNNQVNDPDIFRVEQAGPGVFLFYLGQTFLGFLQDRLSVAKAHGTGRTGLDAGRKEVVLNPIYAHGAFK